MRYSRRLLPCAGVVSAFSSALSFVAPASALPGQSIAAFKTWSHGKILIRYVEKKKAEMSGLPYWTITNADHGISWTFTANTDGTSVTDEALGVSDSTAEPGAAPIRHDGTGYGFTFFKALYGANIAADFLASKAVARIVDKSDEKHPSTTTYYRGKTYGYRLSSASGYLNIFTPAAFAKDMALEQHCALHPNECNE